MAVLVEEIMNHEVCCIRPDETVGDTIRLFSRLGINAAPVVDDSAKPLGFVSRSNMAEAPANAAVRENMTAPADTIARSETIIAAAKELAARNRHHLAVVDEGGWVVGFVGSLDVVRGLLGLPTPHPDTFPHYDKTDGVAWTNDYPLDMNNAAQAPDGPGLLRLVRAVPGQLDRVVWTEATNNVRTRVIDILSGPQPRLAPIGDEATFDTLRFRAASTAPEAFSALAASLGLKRLRRQT